MKQKLSSKQYRILEELSDKMFLSFGHIAGRINISAPIVSANLRSLRKRGLVTYIPDVKQWRITKEGREYVKENN